MTGCDRSGVREWQKGNLTFERKSPVQNQVTVPHSTGVQVLESSYYIRIERMNTSMNAEFVLVLVPLVMYNKKGYR